MDKEREATVLAVDEVGIAQILSAHRGERHIVVIQDSPDPDAISSAFAHELISAAFDIEVDIVHRGPLSHRQNVALVKLLDIELERYGDEFDAAAYDGAVYVDNQGSTAEAITEALEAAGVPILIMVDHHELQERLRPEFSDIRQVGATASIYGDYLQQGLLQLDVSQKDHVVAATALLHGIITDTNGFVLATPADFRAGAYLSRFRDADLLQQIMSQARSKRAMGIIRQALGDRVTIESYTIAGIGYLRAEDRDAIPQAADFLLTEENVHTAIVYGIMRDHDDSETLIGSMRTSRITIDPDDFIKDVFGKNAAGRYFGGGRQAAGGFEIPIGFLSGRGIEPFLAQKWEIYDAQVKHKLYAKIGAEPPEQG